MSLKDIANNPDPAKYSAESPASTCEASAASIITSSTSIVFDDLLLSDRLASVERFQSLPNGIQMMPLARCMGTSLWQGLIEQIACYGSRDLYALQLLQCLLLTAMMHSKCS